MPISQSICRRGVELQALGRSGARGLAGAEGRAMCWQSSIPPSAMLSFMHSGQAWRSTASTAHVSRSGYTGEDGFEISVDR